MLKVLAACPAEAAADALAVSLGAALPFANGAECVCLLASDYDRSVCARVLQRVFRDGVRLADFVEPVFMFLCMRDEQGARALRFPDAADERALAASLVRACADRAELLEWQR
jgi:hypothetical protein